MSKRIISILMLLAFLFCLSGCGMFAAPTEPPAPPESVHTHPSSPPEPSVDPTEQEEPPIASVPDTEPTGEPEHSELYIEGLAVEDVIAYFNEVCLDGEYVHSGDPSVVQKWTEPIVYALHGDPTEQDLEVLHQFTVWLNNYPGFPGIYEQADTEYANLQIYFCSLEELHERMGQVEEDLDGMVTFWYNNNEIYDATICIRNDLDQDIRNSVILEELYNGLGPIQDTQLREDSLIYAGYSTPQALTEIDELILKLLYHHDIRCGMNAEECEAVIRQLYY